MQAKSAKDKGKKLENKIARDLSSLFPISFRRRDSGSGKFNKEDVTVYDDRFPLHIECKKHARLDLSTWWRQTLFGCPANKLPCLIYELDYQTDPTVYMKLDHFLTFVSGTSISAFGEKTIWIRWSELFDIMKDKYKASE